MQHTYTPTADGLSHARAREGGGYSKATGTAPAFTYGRAETVGQTTVTTRYFYDGWNLIGEYRCAVHNGGTLQGAGGVGGMIAMRDTDGNLYYPTYDGNGNVSEHLDSGGDPAAHMEYDSFGNLLPTSTGAFADFPHIFSTKYTETEIGLPYYGYRWYDPVTGRWPSRDPMEEEGGENLYGFVGNDGVDRVDILGLIPINGFDVPSGDPGALFEAISAIIDFCIPCRVTWRGVWGCSAVPIPTSPAIPLPGGRTIPGSSITTYVCEANAKYARDNGHCKEKGIGPGDTKRFELGVHGLLNYIVIRDHTGEEFERTPTE